MLAFDKIAFLLICYTQPLQKIITSIFPCFSFILNILPAYVLQFGVYLTSMTKKMILCYIKS